MKILSGLLAFLGAIGLIVGIALYSTFSWGFVCYKFWYWFVLPIFTTLPLLTFWQAVGLMLFISLFRNHSPEGIKKEFKDESTLWSILIIAPWILLIIGYFFKLN